MASLNYICIIKQYYKYNDSNEKEDTMKKKWLVIATVFLMGMMITGCKKIDDISKNADKLDIITTFYPMYDFTSKIVGNEANVTMLIDSDVEPHDYEPSAKDLARIQDADVFIYNSKEMESWVPRLLDSLKDSEIKIIEASETLQMEKNDEHGEDGHHHVYDPHVWLDPVLAQQQVTHITDELSKAFPENKEVFRENEANFQEELVQLDTDYRQAFQNVPNRTFVTQHAAFGYLAKRYDLHPVAIAGLTPDAEPSSKTLAQLKDFMEANNITVIYTEQGGSSKMAETIAKETNAEILTLHTLESLSKKEREEKEDYLSIMEENLKALSYSIHNK